MKELDQLQEMIAVGESLDREFKSDRRQISDDRASRLLRKLCEENRLELIGKGRGAYYVRKTRG